ncbi:DUF2103 domain-containing protein [Thermococcus alcaliphilus]|uniref:DUF2103 domain-containing protein n=1 Tax=Thermococcus alcaliphilus TaxID=139207 RepID=UPI002090F53B|nr:DUF2103 domain-containing protein [Thermococcus alcaliphilus]MCO6040466.1 DUF2103 domain-containing protein [Thermococcus alcaliphilus]
MPKYFKRGVKREHHFLKGIEKPLEEIASIPEVKKVIPGRIYASDSRGFEIKVTRETHAGLKLVAKSDGSVQEVFLVVDKKQREFVWKKIEELAEKWRKG